jgi:hypothetical protein
MTKAKQKPVSKAPAPKPKPKKERFRPVTLAEKIDAWSEYFGARGKEERDGLARTEIALAEIKAIVQSIRVWFPALEELHQREMFVASRTHQIQDLSSMCQSLIAVARAKLQAPASTGQPAAGELTLDQAWAVINNSVAALRQMQPAPDRSGGGWISGGGGGSWL